MSGYESPVEELIDQVRLMFHALVRRAEGLHANASITVSQRAVLEFLLKQGPTTVPQIARRRGVSRQHIQTLVNPLIEEGLVGRSDNPDHQRSSFLELTGAGRRKISEMKEAEAQFIRSSGLDVSKEKMKVAIEVLSEMRAAIDIESE